MKSSKFVIQLILSFLLLAMPFYHQTTGREMQAVLKLNLDSVAGDCWNTWSCNLGRNH